MRAFSNFLLSSLVKGLAFLLEVSRLSSRKHNVGTCHVNCDRSSSKYCGTCYSNYSARTTSPTRVYTAAIVLISWHLLRYVPTS